MRLVALEGEVFVLKLEQDRKSTRLNSSHLVISYAVFCLKKKKCVDESRNYHRNERQRELPAGEVFAVDPLTRLANAVVEKAPSGHLALHLLADASRLATG